jgi:hypothetical protein
LFTLVLTHSGGAKPHPAPLPRPSGTTYPDEISREAIVPGSYATAINIHNPSLGATVTIYKRVVLAPYEGYGESFAPSPTSPATDTLPPGYAEEVDCRNIVTLLGISLPNPFIKGFVSIFIAEPQTLDVVGVYSAEPPNVTISYTNASSAAVQETEIPGISLEMLHITPEVVTIPAPTAATTVLPGRRFYEYSAKFLCSPLSPP